jgi:hypothetical protein
MDRTLNRAGNEERGNEAGVAPLKNMNMFFKDKNNYFK